MNLHDLIDKYQLNPFQVKVQTLERTFIDKLFSLGDYYLSDRIIGHSRHLYDLYRLYDYITFNEDFYTLFGDVREVRANDSECLSAKPDQNLKSLLKEIYDTDYFKKDYDEITSELLFEKVSYPTVKENLSKIISKLKD